MSDGTFSEVPALKFLNEFDTAYESSSGDDSNTISSVIFVAKKKKKKIIIKLAVSINA